MSWTRLPTREQSRRVIGDVWHCLLLDDNERYELNRYSFTVLTLVEEVLRKHATVFRSIARSLTARPSGPGHGQWRVLEEVFRDGRIHWGRIIVSIALTIRISQELKSQALPAVSALSTLIEFFDMNLTPWVEENGGWVSPSSSSLSTYMY